MGFVLKVVVLGFAVLLGLFFSGVLFPEPEAPLPEDGWWGRGPPQPETDTSIREFKVEIDDDSLQDMYDRLERSRLGEEIIDSQFHYGFPASELKKVVDYWKAEYNWWKYEKIINSFPQYKTQIEGIDVHFLHVKPKSGKPGKPLLLVHGWPGSFWEFYKILPILTDPESIGHNADSAFEVVVPSIPGYGFSEAPHRMGFDTARCAGVFVKLMKRLGYEKFVAQGGDWGSAITTNIAQLYPQLVIGLHTNMVMPVVGDPRAFLHDLVAGFFPNLVLGEEHGGHHQSLTTLFPYLMAESGYFHIQATRPDTVGTGLNDSPMGLAAYILEKFAVWTNKQNINKPDGGLTGKFTLDELLTNIMIYWFSGNIASSQRFYKENIGNIAGKLNRVPVKVPYGGAIFPEELAEIPKPLAEYKFKDIVQYSYMEEGGHFAAFEEPLALAKDFLSFVSKLEKRDGVISAKETKYKVIPLSQVAKEPAKLKDMKEEATKEKKLQSVKNDKDTANNKEKKINQDEMVKKQSKPPKTTESVTKENMAKTNHKEEIKTKQKKSSTKSKSSGNTKTENKQQKTDSKSKP